MQRATLIDHKACFFVCKRVCRPDGHGAQRQVWHAAKDAGRGTAGAEPGSGPGPALRAISYAARLHR